MIANAQQSGSPPAPSGPKAGGANAPTTTQQGVGGNRGTTGQAKGAGASPNQGFRKPHRTVGTEGRRSQSAALTSENWRVTNEGVKAPSLAGKAPLLGSHVSGFTVPPTHCAPRSPTPLRPQASLPRGA